MKTNSNSGPSSSKGCQNLKFTFIAATCLITGLVVGAIILHQLYKHSERERVETARKEIARLFEKFSQEAELKLDRIQPQISKLESDLSKYNYVEKSEDIKLGPYRAQLKKIRILLNEVDGILAQAAKDAERLIEKQKVAVSDIFDEEQRDKISKLKKLYSELSQNLQFLEIQIEMTEQFRNQLQLAEAKQENRELINQIKNVVKEIESIQNGQNNLIELVKMEKLESSNRNNDILTLAKMQTEMAQTMMLANAIQQNTMQMAISSPQYAVDPFYQTYNPPLVIGTSYKVVGERMGPSSGTPLAYRIYPAPYPTHPYNMIHRAGHYTIYHIGGQ